MKQIKLVILVVAIVTMSGVLGPHAIARVKWVTSTATSPWQAMAAPVWAAADDDKPPEVRVEPRLTFQTIDGFGRCFNELGWRALSALPAEERDRVIVSLFGDDRRLGLGTHAATAKRSQIEIQRHPMRTYTSMPRCS